MFTHLDFLAFLLAENTFQEAGHQDTEAQA
jgi:hypothetical protein